MSVAQSPPERKSYTTREAASLLGVSEDAMEKNWATVGGFRVGKAIRFNRAHIDALVAGPEPSEAASSLPANALAELLRALVFEAKAGLQARRALATSAAARSEMAERSMALDDLLIAVLQPDAGDPVAAARLVA